MPILYYSNPDAETREKIKNLLKEFFGPEEVEEFWELTGFLRRLRRPLPEDPFVILAPGGRQEFLEILPFQMQLQNARMIILTPDQETETVALGHLLRPRFMGYLIEDGETLRAVLNKMIAS